MISGKASVSARAVQQVQHGEQGLAPGVPLLKKSKRPTASTDACLSSVDASSSTSHGANVSADLSASDMLDHAFSPSLGIQAATDAAADAALHRVTRRPGPRVVSGFGSERTEDALGDVERRDVQANARARRRVQEGERGEARDLQGNLLDRSEGGAWRAGPGRM